MEIREGYIVGIYNYCDRWCEVCAFAAHCRVFVEEIKEEAERDPSMAKLVAAPPLPEDVTPAPPPAPRPWLEELEGIMAEAQAAVASGDAAGKEYLEPKPLPGPYQDLCDRADAHTEMVYTLVAQGVLKSTRRDANNPSSVIARLALLITMKTSRALRGLVEFDGDREFPPDHEGSAKVALLAIERSLRAWQQIADIDPGLTAFAAQAAQELATIRDALDDAIPLARVFVRPGFDEPDAIAMLMKIT